MPQSLCMIIITFYESSADFTVFRVKMWEGKRKCYVKSKWESFNNAGRGGEG